MMLAYMSEKKIHNALLDIFHTRQNTEKTDEGAYSTRTVVANKKLAIMEDVRGDSGLLFSKIALEDIIPINPDLVQFDNVRIQLPALDESIMDILANYDTGLSYAETLMRPMFDTAHTERQLTLFRKTRALLGLGNLCFTESFLFEDEKYFTIQPAPDCSYYVGTIKVTIK